MSEQSNTLTDCNELEAKVKGIQNKLAEKRRVLNAQYETIRQKAASEMNTIVEDATSEMKTLTKGLLGKWYMLSKGDYFKPRLVNENEYTTISNPEYTFNGIRLKIDGDGALEYNTDSNVNKGLTELSNAVTVDSIIDGILAAKEKALKWNYILEASYRCSRNISINGWHCEEPIMTDSEVTTKKLVAFMYNMAITALKDDK